MLWKLEYALKQNQITFENSTTTNTPQAKSDFLQLTFWKKANWKGEMQCTLGFVLYQMEDKTVLEYINSIWYTLYIRAHLAPNTPGVFGKCRTSPTEPECQREANWVDQICTLKHDIF